jgi:hypothetical protein
MAPEPDIPDPDAQQRFLLAAIEHTQSVIVSIESRVPMALILHGFLFAGIVAVTLPIGPLIDHNPWRALVVSLIIALILSFVISVFFFVVCIAPRSVVPGVNDPDELDIPKNIDPNLFFVSTKQPKWCWWHFRATVNDPPAGDTHQRMWSNKALENIPHYDDFSKAHLSMTNEDVRKALSAELLIVATFRAYKTRAARTGFYFLCAEIGVAVVYLVILGVVYLERY